MRTSFHNTFVPTSPRPGRSDGFSMVELLVVVAMILIMAAVSVPYIYSYRIVYRSEEQSLMILDLMREASQKALNERRTFRFELDLDDNAILIIDENGTNPDVLLKQIPVDTQALLRTEVAPSGGVGRPNPPNYNAAVFANDTLGHRRGATPFINHKVWAVRFKSDGSVVGANDLPVSATLFVYPATSGTSDVPRDKKQVRAVTVYGGSGAVRYWRYDGTTFSAG